VNQILVDMVAYGAFCKADDSLDVRASDAQQTASNMAHTERREQLSVCVPHARGVVRAWRRSHAQPRKLASLATAVMLRKVLQRTSSGKFEYMSLLDSIPLPSTSARIFS